MMTTQRPFVSRSWTRVGAALLAATLLLSAACQQPAAQPTTAPAKPTEAAKPTSAPAASPAAAKPSPAAASPAASPAAKPAASPAASPAAARAITPGPVATKPAQMPTEKTKLRFGGAVTPPSMVHLPPYIAKEMGFFEEMGLDVDIVSFEGGVGALRAAASGLDVVATSSDPLFAGIQNGLPVKAIGTYAPKLSVVMMAAQDIKTPRDLRGRKLGIQEVGGFNHVMSQLVLKSAGLTPNDVQFINVSTANRVSSMVQGQTEATVLHIDQYYAALNANPNFNVMAKLWEVAPDWWYSAFVANEQVIRDKREPLTRFMTAIIKAQRFMYTNAEETKRIAVNETKRTPQEVDRAYADLVNGGVWSVNDGMPCALIDATVRQEIDLGVVKAENPPTCQQIVQRDLIDEAVRRNGGPWTGDPRWY